MKWNTFFFYFFLIFLLLLQYVVETYYLDLLKKNFNKKNRFSYADVRESHYLDFKTCSRIFVFEFIYSFYSIGKGKSLPILCRPAISSEMEINYLYLHG